jgi:hypothetical protein
VVFDDCFVDVVDAAVAAATAFACASAAAVGNMYDVAGTAIRESDQRRIRAGMGHMARPVLA